MSDKNLDRQFDYLPDDVVFCKNCVVSNQRPRITFDKNGICSACQWAFEKDNIIDWDKRESELIQLLDSCRSNDGSFDVVVPGSGGKDSVFVAHQLKHRYNMNPICVTWAPFEYTDIGWKNLHNFVMSGFNNIIGQPDGMIHRKLARLALKYKGDAWEPFAYGQMSWALHIAKMYNVKLIIYGENGDLEYGGSDKLKYKPNDSVEDWEEIYYKSSGIDELVELGIQDKIFSNGEVSKEKLKWYSAPNPDIIKEVGMETHYWSYYHSWVPQENFYYASTYNGFETNNFGHSEGTYTKYVSLDDKSDGFHWYLSFMKFGMSRASRDAQQDIRRNHITRDEGIALTKRYDGEYPIKYHDWFLKYLDITDDELWSYLDKYRDLSNVWEKKDGVWYLKDAVWYEKDDDKSFSGVKRPQQVHPRENRIDDKRN